VDGQPGAPGINGSAGPMGPPGNRASYYDQCINSYIH